MLTSALLFAAALIPLLYSCRRSYADGRVELNHVSLFSLGFIAYWIVPVAFATMLAETSLREMTGVLWGGIVPEENQINTFLLVSIFFYLSFVLGDLLAGFLRPAFAGGKLRPLNPTLLFGASLAGLLIACGAMYRARDLLLRGKYVLDSDQSATRGTVAAACTFLFVVAMLYLVQSRTSRLNCLLFNRYMLIFWPAGLVLFFSGTRLYFLSFVIMLVVYWTVYVRRVRLAKFALILGGSVLLMGIAGVYRMAGIGGGGAVLVNLAAEPLLTSLSLMWFLRTAPLHFFNFPIYLISDFINLVPSVMLPGKAAMMLEIPDIYSPLGALNSFVSFNMNFGCLGTALVLFFLGYGMRRMRGSAGLWARSAYILICGWLGFSFFRDPFSVSIVKSIVEFSIFLPGAIIAGVRFVTYASGQSKTAISLHPSSVPQDVPSGNKIIEAG